MPPPAAPYLDPRLRDWIFDATVLVNCFQGGIAGHLVMCFKGRANLAAEVAAEVGVGPVRDAYHRIAWFAQRDLPLSNLRDYAGLRLRWGSAPDRDRGEAASILLARDHGLVFATDDGVAYKTAHGMGICTTRTPALLVAMVRAGAIVENDAWAAYMAMLSAGSRLGPIPWSDRSDFGQLCSANHFDTC